MTLSRQCTVYTGLPTRFLYLFGKLAGSIYAPAKWKVLGLTRPAGAVMKPLAVTMAPERDYQRAVMYVCLYMCGIVVARGQHCVYTSSIVVIYESKEVEKGSLVRVAVACPKGWVAKTVRVLTVWTFDVVQQTACGQNSDNADCAWCLRTNIDLAGKNVAEWCWAGSVWPCQQGYPVWWTGNVCTSQVRSSSWVWLGLPAQSATSCYSTYKILYVWGY